VRGGHDGNDQPLLADHECIKTESDVFASVAHTVYKVGYTHFLPAPDTPQNP